MRDRNLTLEELEGEVWPEPPERAPGYVTRCHALRKVPTCELGPGDLRVLLSHEVGVKHLLPWAVEALQLNPLAEGDYYPGDLLTAVIQLPPQYLSAGSLLAQVRDAAERARRELQVEDELLESDAELLKDVEAFLATHHA